MARGFTQKRKEAIRIQLIIEGKQLFGRFGLKKTNIVQLTEAVGISPATFYKFFESKEELFFIIIEEEALNIRTFLLEQIGNSNSQSQSATFQSMLKTIVDLYKKDPFMEQLLGGNGLNQMLLALSKNEIEGHVLTGYDQFTPAIENLQKQGKVISSDPKVLITIMQLFFMLNEQRSHFDSNIFDKAMKLLAVWIAEGFTNEKTSDSI